MHSSNAIAQTSPEVKHGVSPEVLIPTAKKPFIDETIPGFTIGLNQTTDIKEKLLCFGVNMDDNPRFIVGNFLEKELSKKGVTVSISFARHGVPVGHHSPLINTLLDAITAYPKTFVGHKAVIMSEVQILEHSKMKDGKTYQAIDAKVKYYLIVDCTGRKLQFTQSTEMPIDENAIFVLCEDAAMRAS